MNAVTQEVESADPGEVRVHDHGSVWLFIGSNEAACAALRSLTCAESWQWLGSALTVDHRYAADLVDHLRGHDVEVVLG